MTFTIDGVNYSIKKDLNVEITFSPGAYGDIIIPKSVCHQGKKYVISGISSNAFTRNKNLNSVSFSNDSEVDFIEKEAFAESSITSITVPPQLTKIGLKAFYYCSKLKTITFTDDSNLEIIDNSAFLYSGLTSIEIPSRVQQIGVTAFSHCEKLSSVNFWYDSELNYIGQSAFSFCSKLTNISIPPHVKSIGSSAFSYCTTLKKVIFSKDSEITTMDVGIFSMSPLESVSIPPKFINYNQYFRDCPITSLELYVSEIVIDSQIHSCFKNLKELLLPEAKNVKVESRCGNFKILIRRNVVLYGPGRNEHPADYIDQLKRPQSCFLDKKSSIKLAPPKPDLNLTTAKKVTTRPKTSTKRSIKPTFAPVDKTVKVLDSDDYSDSDKNVKELELRIIKLEQELKSKIKEISELQASLKKERADHKITQKKLSELTEINNKKETKSDDTSSFKRKKIQLLSVEEIDQYKKIKKIGTGATSKVLKVSRPENFALKIFKSEICSSENKNEKKSDYSDNDEEYEEDKIEIDIGKMNKFFYEFELLNQLDHPNVIKTFGFCYGDSTHPPSILLEFCPCNLSYFIKKKRINDVDLVRIIFEICNAMKYIHKIGIIHRDLKPENILLDSNKRVKLSDFGISKLISPEFQTGTSYTSGVGTLPYMAPELLKNNGKYNEKVDVYAFGVVLYFVLNDGKLPNINIIDVGTGQKANIPKSVNEVSKNLIYKCWSFKADDRPSFAQITDYIVKNKYQLLDGVNSREVASSLRD